MNSCQHRMIRWLQKHSFHSENSFFPLRNEGIENEKGYQLHHDICYGQAYPNSFLDIYRRQEWEKELHPVLLYFHGGGWVWGDKADGDPTGGKNQSTEDLHWFFHSFVDAGYTVVCPNYAFAPEYTYPTPLYQTDQVVRFLLENQHVYGLNMSKLVIGGGSAGGHMAAQYACVLTNSSYAAKLRIKPVLKKEQLRAMVLHSAVLDPGRMDQTDLWVFNLIFRNTARAYFDCKLLKDSAQVAEANLLKQVTEDFPPTFFSESNTGSFSEQSKELDEGLKKKKIAHEFVFFPKEEHKLVHGYEAMDTIYARRIMERAILFLENHK